MCDELKTWTQQSLNRPISDGTTCSSETLCLRTALCLLHNILQLRLPLQGASLLCNRT